MGFDIIDMGGALGIPRPRGIELVLQDVLTIHGAQFRNAALIVASPPCQAYSYRAMPWKRAKALPPPDNTLFEACFRIQREAIEAAGHHIPLVVENVCGAQKWVGRARWHYGSFYLWGDVPALMPITKRSLFKDGTAKVGGFSWDQFGTPGYKARAFNGEADKRLRSTKNDGGSWFNVAHNTTSGKGQNPDGRKVPTDRMCDCGHPESEHGFNPDQPCNLCSCINPVWVQTRRTGIGTGARFTSRDCGDERKNGGDWFGSGENCSLQRRQSSKSSARKAASAHIAKIPLPLARHIARAWHPEVAA